MNVLSEYSLKKQNEDLLKILESTFPDNDIIIMTDDYFMEFGFWQIY